MRDLLEALWAGLKNPEEVAWLGKREQGRSQWQLSSLLVGIMSLVAILASSLLGNFSPFFLLYIPTGFLLWFVCGGIAYIWSINSKGTATFSQTILATPIALFFPVLLTVLLFSLSELYLVPLLLQGKSSLWVRFIDFILSFAGPIYGWFFYYKVLVHLHGLKATHAMGASLVALFVVGMSAYFLQIALP